MTRDLHKTPLHAWHEAHGGRMVDFAGWSMPVQYTSIVQEHLATRSAVGLFDISHMGRLWFSGSEAARFLDHLVTRRIVDAPPGKIRYALITNPQGGILDDVLVYHLPQGGDGPTHLMVVNAGNRIKILDWIAGQTDGHDVQWVDGTPQSAMLAVQGPRALEIVHPLLDFDPAEVGYYVSRRTKIEGAEALFSRTGYTGEDGCELIVGREVVQEVWRRLVSAAAEVGGCPAGLGARDTLRLEAAMPLYGHELSESIDPYQAGLSFAVNLKDRDFIGRDALRQLKGANDRRKRVGLKLAGRRAAREHYSVYRDERQVGEVTSGTFSPTCQCPIAMAYIDHDCAGEGEGLEVDIRGSRHAAQVVALPFYSRPT